MSRGAARTAATRNLRPGEIGAVPRAIVRRYFPRGTWRREGVGDDGSCFFHSLARILNFSDYVNHHPRNRNRLGHNLRRLLREKVTSKSWFDFWKRMRVPAHRVPTCFEIRERMRKPSQWADVYMISWIMDYLGLSLYFFDTANDRVYCGVRNRACPGPDDCDAGFILWIDHSHFEPIGRCGEPGDASSGVPSEYLLRPDDPHVSHVERVYEQADRCGRVRIGDVLGA